MYIRRNEHAFYSKTKTPTKILFWNIQSLEQLERNLNRWLDGEINDGERIRSIERLVSYMSIVDDKNSM